MQATKGGKKVGIVEQYPLIGGACTHSGTIPSKALRFAIFQVTEASRNRLFREAGIRPRFTFGELRRSAESVISQQVEVRKTHYDRNEVPIFQGRARLIDPNTVEVEQESGGRRFLRAKSLILAVGARPYRPKDIDFTHPRIFDSDTILRLEETPHSITIYGAGIIGCEYASMFRNLGCKVNLINTRSKLLEFLDDEITDALAYHLREQGILIRHNEEYQGMQGLPDGVVVSLKSGKQIDPRWAGLSLGEPGFSDRDSQHLCGWGCHRDSLARECGVCPGAVRGTPPGRGAGASPDGPGNSDGDLYQPGNQLSREDRT